MALSYLTECEAPRDFRVSSTESESHYIKCLLCYTIKKNFYCVDCIKTGNFVHSTMPYADRFSEKQGKLLRLKANRKHILDRCEKLLQMKSKKDRLHMDTKQSRDKIALLKLAIEQRKKNVEEKRKELVNLSQYNNELRAKLPKYQKRVSNLGKHTEIQKVDLQKKINVYQEKSQALASLRRTRIRQLTKYIFPVYITYETSAWSGTDSADELEFLGVEEVCPVQRPRLHIVVPWLPADGDYSAYSRYVPQNKESGSGGTAEGAENPEQRLAAGLSLAAQLIALLAWCLDIRLPHSLNFRNVCMLQSEYGSARIVSGANSNVAEKSARRLGACVVALALRSGHSPPPYPPAALAALHELARAAAIDEPQLGRVEAWLSSSLSGEGVTWEEAWPPADSDDDEPPEHLHWADVDQAEELANTPPAPAASLMTSAAASLASIWRVWAK